MEHYTSWSIFNRRQQTSERKRLKRRQEVEPLIGHVKHDHRMSRCRLIGSRGDALHLIACAAGQSADGIRWLMRATLRLGLKGLLRL